MGSPINPKYPIHIKDMREDIYELQNTNVINTINVYYKELIKLRDNNKLIPGQQYRITDYVATTSDPESRSANHPFDIIVTADDTKTLNENARAIQHEGDEYFKHCNLAAWKLKYCIDNDINRFTWAIQDIDGYKIVLSDGDGSTNIYAKLISSTDTTIEGYNYLLSSNLYGMNINVYTNTLNYNDVTPTLVYLKSLGETEEFGEIGMTFIEYIKQEGGKGVIYEMIDEHNNRAPYDFKGIQFKRYNGYVENYPDIKVSLIPKMPGIGITNEDNPIYAFLCCTAYDWNIDTSIGTFAYTIPQNYYISDYIGNYNLFNIHILPNIVVETYDSSAPNKLYIGNNSHNITAHYGHSVIIEDSCYNILVPYGNVHIKRDCENLINVNISGEGAHYTILNGRINVEPLYYFGGNTLGYYKLNVPQEIIDFCNNNHNKIVNVWRTGDKLYWYHLEIGIINSDV